MYYHSEGPKAFLISFFTSLIVSVGVCFAFWKLAPMLEKGGKKVEVPNLKNIDVETAKLLVESKGLMLIVEGEREDPTVEKGKIIFQNPMPGSELKKGEIVKVIVSKGPPPEKKEEIVIPDLSGMTLSQAKVLLTEKGLNPGKVTYERSTKYDKDIVIRTIPEAGSKVPEGFSVELVVSEGAPLVTVPSLYGKTVSAARRILEARGLRLGSVNYVTDVERPFDIIIGQSPKAGSSVPKGSKVNVTVNAEAGTY